MTRPLPRVRPVVEALDPRLVMSVSHPGVSVSHPPAPMLAVARAFTPGDLQAYADAYLASRGDARYNPLYDFNGNGFIGQGDATPILRALASTTPRVPPRLELALAPGERVTGHHPTSNGGVTRRANVTVIGRTTPNSIIFTDGPVALGTQPTGDFHFRGIALTSDAQGFFRYSLSLAPLSHSGSLTNTAFLVHDPFGRQMIRSFPILRIR